MKGLLVAVDEIIMIFDWDPAAAQKMKHYKITKHGYLVISANLILHEYI